MKKIFTAAIIGCGNRGAGTYGKLFDERKDKYRITALCDRNAERLRNYGKLFGVDGKKLFINEKDFWKEKHADLLVIGTMDSDHVPQCIKALALGYDVLLEKPITDKREECEKLLEAQRKYGGKVLVCHVLRYAPAYLKAAAMLKSGAVGRLVAIQSLEQVAYWHDAHSFVRGNWRRRDETVPMILAKGCHDLDLLQYFAGAKCESVSSVGDLAYFKAENAPEGATERCLDCPHSRTCPYSALPIYIDTWKEAGCPADIWPHMQVTTAYPITEEALIEGLRTGPYGRCVYRCDNDVVDHQFVEMTFENGVKVSHTMMAFTATFARIYKFYGTMGELVLDEEQDAIFYKPFGGETQKIVISKLVQEDAVGHGGGDIGIVETLYEVLCGNADNATSLEASIESHLIGICAEESRLQGGKLIKVH